MLLDVSKSPKVSCDGAGMSTLSVDTNVDGKPRYRLPHVGAIQPNNIPSLSNVGYQY